MELISIERDIVSPFNGNSSAGCGDPSLVDDVAVAEASISFVYQVAGTVGLLQRV